MEKLSKYQWLMVIALLVILIVSFSSPPFLKTNHTAQYVLDYRNNIIKSWRLQDDSNYVIVFKANGICYEYYQGKLQDTFTYTVSNTSPQGSEDVGVDESQYTFYLRIVSVNDSSLDFCYIINNASKVLSITEVETGLLAVFSQF